MGMGGSGLDGDVEGLLIGLTFEGIKSGGLTDPLTLPGFKEFGINSSEIFFGSGGLGSALTTPGLKEFGMESLEVLMVGGRIRLG